MQHRNVEIARDRSLYGVQAGSGPDLVLLHGALGTHRDWLIGPFDALARDFRVTALDRPGHGQSLRPRFEGTPRDQARQIREGLLQMGVEQAVVVGHSLGALVTLALAEQYPDFVRSLVLVGPVGFPEPRPLEHFLFTPRAFPFGGPAFSRMADASFDRPALKMVQRLMFLRSRCRRNGSRIIPMRIY